jgi:vesicle transport through interaction with t-SNAREs protein 1
MRQEISSSLDSSLDRTTRALADTERFGQLTSAQLLIQRESFLRQRNQLTSTNEFLSRSKNLLQRMQFRVVTDKIVQGVIILVELALIGGIVYFKYYR